MGEFSLGERLAKQEALPDGHWPSYPNHKQYRLPGRKEEIISTKKELAQEHHRSFHSHRWLGGRPNASWRTTVDDRGLNKVTLILHATVPNITSLFSRWWTFRDLFLLLIFPMLSLASLWPLHTKTNFHSLGRKKAVLPWAYHTAQNLSWPSGCGSG